MSGASIAAGAGAAATAYGAYESSQREEPSMPSANPNDVQGLLGGVEFDEEGNATVTSTDKLKEATEGLFAGGQQMLDEGVETASKDFGDLRDEELSTLRELARPEEEQAAASTASRLYNQGALGSTGGALQMQELEEAQADADLKRQQASIDLANQQKQMGMEQAQLGSGLLSSGTSIGQAPLQTANIGMGSAAQQSEAQLSGARLQQQGSQADRQYYSNLVGSATQTAGGALSGGGGGGLFSSTSK